MKKAVKFSTPDDPATCAAAYVKLGYVYQQLNQHRKAVKAFKRALALGHTTADLWDVLGGNTAKVALSTLFTGIEQSWNLYSSI